MRRPVLSRALVVASCVALVLALIAGYARRAGVNSDQFANRATTALRDDSVRSLIAEKVTDEVILKHKSDLLAVRPLIESVVSNIVGSRAFTSLFRAGVRDVHRAVIDRDQDTFTLTVGDVGTVAAAALQQLRPSVADEVDATGRVELIERDVGSVSGDLARIADRIRLLAPLLALLTLALGAGALVLAPDRRRAVVELGVGVAASGVVLVVAYSVTRSLAIHHVEQPDGQAAAGAVWDAFLGDLRVAAWIVAGSGAVVAAAAASLIRPVDIRVPLRRAADWVATEPERPALRVLRGLAFLAVGLLVVFEHDAVLELALTLLGVYLIYEGVTTILRLVYRAPAPGAARRPLLRGLQPRRAAGPLIAVALIVGAVGVFVGAGGTTTAAPARGTCNGSRALCDRPLDQVVLPATHNAMSVPLPGWYSAHQEAPIADQLSDGVRGLLIDTHYAEKLGNGKLRTELPSDEGLLQRAKQDGVSPESIAAAKRIRERLGFRGKGERGMYLCHTFCELGGTPLASVLDDIRDFLVAHPGEVLVVINEDYVRPQEFVTAVRDAGLEDLVYRGPTSGTWPTLGEMIDRNQRVLFMAENRAGGAPWYHSAYKGITQETPFSFGKVRQLTRRDELPASCEPNRGTRGAPIFLMNHWITTDPLPLPSNAAKVNAFRPLLRRAEVCRRLRGQLPNLVAVDFYREGDLFRVVDRLNGLR